MKLDGFNRIARLYDPLKRLVFGKAIFQAQIEFISSVPASANILILGGGTGEMLQPLWDQNVAYRIWYVEASSEMIAQARARVRDNRDIAFIHGTEESLPSDVQFDAVITNFFLDLFPDATSARICRQLQKRLADGGVWLVSDFVNRKKWWHEALLFVMYKFFNVASAVEAKTLPAWQEHLRLAGMHEKASRTLYGGFIKTCVYIKAA